jgi:hypothetical protein
MMTFWKPRWIDFKQETGFGTASAEARLWAAIVSLAAALLLVPAAGWAQTSGDTQGCKDPVTSEPLPPIRVESSPRWDTGERAITFDHVPCRGVAGERVTGRVKLPAGEKFSAYQVCLYILVAGGWWTKPTFTQPSVEIRDDGSWEAPFTTGGSDHQASQILAVLIPRGYHPPASAGRPSLPIEIAEGQFAKALADRGQRRIEFSGLSWTVKDLFWDPGPNQFSNSAQNVSVDGQGLHLRITRRGGQWLCAEVVSESSFGYGRYLWTVSSPVGGLNENCVLGLFTFDADAPQAAYRELDVELSRWGDPGSPNNAQYVTQPYEPAGHLHGFNLQLGTEPVSTQIIDWRRDGIRFRTIRGDYSEPPDAGYLLQEWFYPPSDLFGQAQVPEPGKGNVRMNLWLFNRRPPSDAQEVEVIIHRFTYIP